MAFYTRGARRSVRAHTFRRTPLAAARAQASRIARSARIAAYREAPMLANLAVRGLSLAPGEFKSVDVHAATAVTTTPLVVLLNGIARGDDINERTGREVDMRSIQFSAQVRAATATGVDQTHRVLIVYDRQTNAAAPTMAQVCESATIQAPRNLENRKRFSILFDEIYNLNAAAESGSSRQIRWYRHLNHPETFNSGDAATVADITTGSVYLIVLGTEAAGATSGSIDYWSRIRYQDK